MIQRRGKTVLCIGDDPVNLNLRCSLLKEHGWNVLSSGSGHEGVLRFVREEVDAVVLDLKGGDESALITGELKRLHPEVPVILLVMAAAKLDDAATRQANLVIAKSQESSLLVGTLRAFLPPD